FLVPHTPLQSYTVTLEAHHQPWLLVLDPPFSAPAGTSFSTALEVLLKRPLHQVYRYRMTTAETFKRSDAGPENIGLIDSESGLSQVAIMRNPRSFELGRSWAAVGLNDEALVEKLLDLFRQAPFRYILEPPSLGGSGPVDEFLFQTKAGFCEHYAGSAAFLLRAAGLRARVVGGYLGGERHPLGGYLIVRQYNAHAWIEVQIRDQGWVRIDPTAAVAPERVEIGIAAAFPESDAFFTLRKGVGFGWLRKLGQYRDLAEFYWNYWVLGYGPKLQNLFLGRFGLGLHNLNMWIAALIGLPFLALALGVGILKIITLEKVPPEVKLYRRYCRGWARRGQPRKLSETPTAYAQRLARIFPLEAQKTAAIAAHYLELRYGKNINAAAQLKRLRSMCR
ncbi:MAG: transglutaminaseTgpA domain-containing protein, partial [Pseudomonadota bacterium]|nr:transglutaminaseTgpA domain-containing protein [Pseudomonadota bacterium]